jgi:hypothetical protein
VADAEEAVPDGLKQLLQSALDSDMTQVAISPVALSELS